MLYGLSGSRFEHAWLRLCGLKAIGVKLLRLWSAAVSFEVEEHQAIRSLPRGELNVPKAGRLSLLAFGCGCRIVAFHAVGERRNRRGSGALLIDRDEHDRTFPLIDVGEYQGSAVRRPKKSRQMVVLLVLGRTDVVG